MATFDDAKNASMNMFNQIPQDDPQQPTNQEPAPAPTDPGIQPTDPGAQPTDPGAQPADQSQQQDPASTSQNVQGAPQSTQQQDPATIAQIAAQAAVDRQNALTQAQQQAQMLQEQNAQLQKQLQELSTQQESAVTDQAVPDDVPMLDFQNLAFLDEEEAKSAVQQFVDGISSRAKSEAEKAAEEKYGPVLDYARRGMENEQAEEVYGALKTLPDLQDIEDYKPQISKILRDNPILSKNDVELGYRIATAYAIAKGINKMNTPQVKQGPPSIDELMNHYRSNPDFQNAIEQDRIAKLNPSQQVPQVSASSGAVNAALNIQDKPKTLEEASERTRKMFGM